MGSVRRRHREKSEDYLETLLNSVTLDQLRSTVIRLYKSKPPSISTRDEAIQALYQLGRVNDIQNTLIELEASTPTKHCLIVKYDEEFDSSLINTDDVLSWQSDTPSLHFKVIYKNSGIRDQFIYTFEHNIDVCEWRITEEDEAVKRRENFILRHPVILRVLPKEKLIIFFYPGYSQGSGIKQSNRLTYQTFLLNLIGKLEEKLSIKFSSVPVERCVKTLSDAHSQRVKIIKTDFESGKGRMSLAAPSKEKLSVDEYLTNFITPFVKEGDERKLHSAVREALKNTTPESLAVLWVKEDLVTRLSFWEFGTEFLFIWYGKSQSMVAINRIFDLILSITQNIESPSLKNLFNEFTDIKKEEVFTLSALNLKYSVNIGELRQAVVDAVKAGLIAPVYRIKTEEILQQTQNSWTEDLVSLKRIFDTESNHQIDGSNPENVEVAFKKIVGDVK